MTRDDINAYCASLPGSEVSDPWGGGHDVWKVGGKSFAFMGTVGTGVSVKCQDAETAAMLIDIGHAAKAPYLPRGGWVFFEICNLDDDELHDRLCTSYKTVRNALPKKTQNALGPVA